MYIFDSMGCMFGCAEKILLEASATILDASSSSYILRTDAKVFIIIFVLQFLILHMKTKASFSIKYIICMIYLHL